MIPPRPGIASAVGMLEAPIRHDYATSVDARTHEKLASLHDTFETMKAHAVPDLEHPEAENHF